MKGVAVQRFTRAHTTMAGVIAIVAASGMVLTAVGSIRWALALLFALVAVCGILLMEIHGSNRRSADHVAQTLRRLDAEGRSHGGELTRISDGVTRVNGLTLELATQTGNLGPHLDASIVRSAAVEDAMKRITRDLYDLELTSDERLTRIEGLLLVIAERLSPGAESTR